MSERHCSVLIVGAGVGGLSMSALLARQGVHSLLIEKRRATFIYPKARNLTFRSLEILRRLSVGDAVDTVAEHISTMVCKETLSSPKETGVLDAASFLSGIEGLSPEPYGKYCPQSRLEPILLDEARRQGSEVRYGTELVSFTQDDARVVATIKDLDSGVQSVVLADYLVVADGTHSPIRRGWPSARRASVGCRSSLSSCIFVRRGVNSSRLRRRRRSADHQPGRERDLRGGQRRPRRFCGHLLPQSG
jgi:putative polyketide hydroxylase